MEIMEVESFLLFSCFFFLGERITDQSLFTLKSLKKLSLIGWKMSECEFYDIPKPFILLSHDLLRAQFTILYI